MMKNAAISTLFALIISSSVAPAVANEAIAIDRVNASSTNRMTPFSLVYGSYQGHFSDRGVPAYFSLLSGIRSHKIKAEDLVKGAIASGKLAEDTLNDTKYLNSVESLLNQLSRH